MTQPPEIVAGLLAYLRSLSDKTSPFDNDPECAPTGSRVICTPPVLNTDDDWLIYVPPPLQNLAILYMEQQGATYSSVQKTYPDGVCFHFGEVNPILIWDYSIFYRWVAATYWAKQLNLRDKADRTRFFQATVDATIPLKQLILGRE